MSTPSLPVLIVDDQPPVRKALQILLDLHGIPHLTASTPREARRIAAVETLGAVIQDMNFEANETSGREGTELFRALRASDPGLPVLLLTAWACLESAVELVKDGASDYISKPWDDDKLIASLHNLLELRRLAVENQRLRAETSHARRALAARHHLCGLVYASEEMHRVVTLAVNVAASDAPVLITGPSGSGKERVAEIIQANSKRQRSPFVRVNVGAIPGELMEAELFGAEVGAYTGIASRRIGHFESADRGTLFLDEIDALSLPGQVKLLRVLQSGEFRRLGSSRALHADVRVISATNAELASDIAAGRFREDLYYRLNVLEIEIPGLARRQDDILPLAHHFLAAFATAPRLAPMRLGAGAEEALLTHSWPGNVRELENRIQRATVVVRGDEVTPQDLGLGEASLISPSPTQSELGERRQIVALLARHDGVVAHAAEELGISRQALYRRMARLGVELERRPRHSSQDQA